MRESPELTEMLRGAQRALGALGERPTGDAAALHALAQVIRQEADLVAQAGRLEASVPAAVVYGGPGARRLSDNVGEVARSLFDCSRRLDHVADLVKHKADQIHTAQAGYDRAFRDLSGNVSRLQSQMPGRSR